MKIIKLKRGEQKADRRTSRRRLLKSPSRDAVPRNAMARARFSLERLPRLRRISGGRWIAIAAGIGALVGTSALFRAFLLESEYFEVREWPVENVQRLPPEEVVALARGGDVDWPINLFAFEPGEAVEKLKSHPVIRDAKVWREPPGTVRMMVQERRQRAVFLAPGGRGLLADMDGVLFAEATTEEMLDRELLLLTTASTMHVNVGDRLPEDLVARALEYHGTLRNSVSPLADQVSEYHWSEELGLVLVMRSGARLICGRLRPEETLFKAEGLLDKYPRLRGISSADLRVDSHVPWMPVPTPTPTPKPRR